MGYAVKPANYKTCPCGKVCKGGPALSNHAAKCATAKVKLAFDHWCLDNGKPLVSNSAFQRHYEAIRAALTDKGYLDADGEVNHTR